MTNENQTTPTSLEDAMRLVRQGNQQATDSSVGSTGVEQNGDLGTEQQPQPSSIGSVSEQSETQNQLWNQTNEAHGESGESNTTPGGYSDSSNVGQSGDPINPAPRYNYQEIGKQYIESASRQAVQAANEIFRENGIKKMSINDLYERDETGRVSFTNPDDPNRPFSSRTEAQEWVNSINAQIDSEWKKLASQYQRQYLEEIMPAMRLLQFGPTYEKMSKGEQDIFDELIAPYEVTDGDGNVIGYSCDLVAFGNVARNIYAKTGAAQQQGQGAAQTNQNIASGPALDATTSGSITSSNGKSEEPTNIQEAMIMLKSQKQDKK